MKFMVLAVRASIVAGPLLPIPLPQAASDKLAVAPMKRPQLQTIK